MGTDINKKLQQKKKKNKNLESDKQQGIEIRREVKEALIMRSIN